MKPQGHTRKFHGKDYKYDSWHWKRNSAEKVMEDFHKSGYNACIIEGKNEAGYTVYLVYSRKKKIKR